MRLRRCFPLAPCTIRLITLPANALVLVLMLIVTGLPLGKMPEESFSRFVFWTLKPMIVILLIFSVAILSVGFLGGVKYDPCWQCSYSIFLFFSLIVASLWMASNNALEWSISSVIPKLYSQGEYVDVINDMAKELNCFDEEKGRMMWDDEGVENCYTKIRERVGDFDVLSRQCCITAIIVLTLYCAMNFAIFFVVTDAEDDMRESVPMT